MQMIVTNCTKDLADLLPLMPRSVDLVWHRGPVPTSRERQGSGPRLPPGPRFPCRLVSLDPRGEGVLMIGLDSDALGKHIAREELRRDVRVRESVHAHPRCRRRAAGR